MRVVLCGGARMGKAKVARLAAQLLDLAALLGQRSSSSSFCALSACARRRNSSMSARARGRRRVTRSLLITSRAEKRGFRSIATGDSTCLPTSVQTSMNNASSLAVNRTTWPPSPHSLANVPFSSRFWKMSPRSRCTVTHAVIRCRSGAENRNPGRPRFSRATLRRRSRASQS